MGRDNLYDKGLPIDQTSGQPIGQSLSYQIIDGEVVAVSSDNPATVKMGQSGVDGITLDAWGTFKTVSDFSLFRSLFTYDIPAIKWRELVNGVEQTTFINASVVDGKMNLQAPASLNDVAGLCSYRHPRYEANRGYHYAASVICPNPTADAERDWGIFLDSGESGVYFRLKSDGQLYARLDTTISGVPTNVVEELIDIPFTIDFSKGFITDIQFQWRGIGNYTFWIGDPATGKLVKVHTIDFMNTSADLSMYNPACPVAFRVKNLGDQAVLNCGCVDVSSEGGNGENFEYGSIPLMNESGQVAVSGFNVPVIVVRSKLLFNGLDNTRDTQAFAASGYADQRAVLKIWVTRDETAITLNDQVWTDFGDGHLEYILYDTNADGSPLVGTPMTFDTTKALNTFSSRVDQDQTFVTPAPQGDGKVWQTPGDIFIFTMHRETGGSVNVGSVYEFLEAI